jgi:DNA-binding MarR family transcriptional regulator
VNWQTSHKNRDGRRTFILTESEVQDAARLLAKLTGAQIESTPVDLARKVFRERRRRIAIFGNEMFGEAGWDILLLLYTDVETPRHKVGMLANFTGAAPTTVARWLDYLEERAWVKRWPHPTDLRIILVELTDRGRSRLDSYFSNTLHEVR